MLVARLYCSSPLGGPPPRAPEDSASTPGRDSLFATPLLIVEDEAMIAWMIEDVLAEAGFATVAIAPNAAQAEALAAADAPGLLISDINLGAGKDGIAASAAIRGATRLPVIFVSAYADPATRDRIDREVPGAQVLRKPIDHASLVRAVMRALGN